MLGKIRRDHDVCALSLFERDPARQDREALVERIEGILEVGLFRREGDIDRDDVLRAEAAGVDPAKAVLAPFVIHDLRRTAASGMARLGIAPHVVEAVLNHRTGTVSGVAKVYNRFNYEAEKRAALETWGRYVRGLIGEAPADNVVQIGAR